MFFDKGLVSQSDYDVWQLIYRSGYISQWATILEYYEPLLEDLAIYITQVATDDLELLLVIRVHFTVDTDALIEPLHEEVHWLVCVLGLALVSITVFFVMQW